MNLTAPKPKRDVIASIEKSLRGQATAQSERLGKNIPITGWRLNPTADKIRKGLIYYATDWNWDGGSVLSIRVLLLGRFGYTRYRSFRWKVTSIRSHRNDGEAKTVASYKPDPETAYSDLRQGRDKVAAVGGLGVLATVLGVKYGKVAAVGAVGLSVCLKGKALLLLALPFLLLGGLFRASSRGSASNHPSCPSVPCARAKMGRAYPNDLHGMPVTETPAWRKKRTMISG